MNVVSIANMEDSDGEVFWLKVLLKKYGLYSVVLGDLLYDVHFYQRTLILCCL